MDRVLALIAVALALLSGRTSAEPAPATRPVGIIRLPDGTPASDVVVLLATPTHQPVLENNRPQPGPDDAAAHTGPDGRFALPETAGLFELLALHDAGFAWLTRDEFERSRGPADLTLTRWARVEGTVRIGQDVAANAEMHLHDGAGHRDANEGSFVNTINRARADDDGRYAFHRVFPGPSAVARMERVREDLRMTTGLTPFTAEPGRTHVIDVGGAGRPIVGRVVVPAPDRMPEGWSFSHGTLHPKPAPERASTAAARAAREAQRRYAFAVGPDGSYRVEDVVPGRYTLTVEVHLPAQGTEGKRVGRATTEVTVAPIPGGRSDEPQQVPDVPVEPQP